LHIGSSDDAVKHVFGAPATILSNCGFTAFAYTFGSQHAFPKMHDFVFK